MRVLADTIVLFALALGVGCAAWRSGSQPPTGWADVRFSQMHPGCCQDKAYDYCRRLRHRGIKDCRVLVVQLHSNGSMHAVVETRNVIVDPTAGQVWYAANYTEGDIVGSAL